MVLDPLAEEIKAIKKSAPIQDQIDKLMEKKESLETTLNNLEVSKYEEGKPPKKEDVNHTYAQIDKVNQSISELITQYKTHFNPYWGELMRAGQEESRMADQVEKYACLYVAKISDLMDYSPRTYFRPNRRVLPHEVEEL